MLFRSVVVIQEWWGLQDQIKGMFDRFALAGFDALAPDLYKGTVVPYHDTDAAGKEMNSLDFIDATTQTVRGAVQYLSRNGAKVGLTGFCLGGAVTIIGAAKIPELTAGVVFYGIPPEQAARPADIKWPGWFAPRKRPTRFAPAASSRCWERWMTESGWRKRRRPPTSRFRSRPISPTRTIGARRSWSTTSKRP